MSVTPANVETVVFLARTKEEAAEMAWNAALAAMEEAARQHGHDASAEVERCNPDDVSGYRNYWLGSATMAGKLRAAIRALKREAK